MMPEQQSHFFACRSCLGAPAFTLTHDAFADPARFVVGVSLRGMRLVAAIRWLHLFC